MQPTSGHLENIGTQGIQELLFVNEMPLEVMNSTSQLMVLPVWPSVKSNWSV